MRSIATLLLGRDGKYFISLPTKYYQILIVVFLLFLLFLPTCFSAFSAQLGNISLKVDSKRFEIEKNATMTLTNLTAYVRGNLTKLPLNFTIVNHPLHGMVNLIKNKSAVKLKYIPDFNYTGPDSFTFKANAIGTASSSNIGKIDIIINPVGTKLLFIAPPQQRATLAFILSLIIVFLIFLVAYLSIRKRRLRRYKPKFWDIVRDENWYPSLAIFQFLLWTGIVLFAYFGVYLVRLFSGSTALLGIPPNLFAVMGISAGVTIVNGFVSKFKYGETTPPAIDSTRQVPPDESRKRLPSYKTMIMENNKITLPRFQMFAWTWIGIISYLALLFSKTDLSMGNIEGLALPELPILFVSLMGLSQVTYQAVKAAKPAIFSINEVRPRKIQLQNKNNLVTVLGSNFGTNGTTWIEYYRPITDEEKEELGYNTLTDEEKEELGYDARFLEEQLKVDPEIPREDNRIIFKLDSIINKLKSQRYLVRVEKDGLLTSATSDATFEITKLSDEKKELNVKLSLSQSQIKVGDLSNIRVDVTKQDNTYANKINVLFHVDKPDIAEFKDNVFEQLTDSNGLASVILVGKSKGTVTVSAKVKVNGDSVEDNANIDVT